MKEGFMVSESLEQLQPISAHSNIAIRSTQQISYTVGVMAYNEEANIQRTLTAILEQTSAQTRLAEIIVIASGCTDRTVPIAEEMQKQDSRIRLIVQEKREG